MDIRNKKITVIGLGESGIKVALLLYDEGAVVTVSEKGDNEIIRKNSRLLRERYIDFELGRHTEGFLKDTELFVVSPGVENSALPIQYAERNDIPIISELELGYNFCCGPIVAVTGTNGKSTVVSLIGEILNASGIRAKVCGNIGNSLSGEVKKISKNTVAVLEVSSFQLERIESFKPKISVILNVTEDHLDRHKSFNDYLKAKIKVFKNQTKDDIAILNYDDKVLRDVKKLPSRVLYFSTSKKVEGVYLERGKVKLSLRNKVKTLFDISSFTEKESNKRSLRGKHNIENILLCSLVASLLGAKEEDIEKAINSFKPLAHRFENVKEINGVTFIDDSKATNIDSTYRAVQSIKSNIILIAGGKDKNLSYGKVSSIIKDKVKCLFLIGETKDEMADIFKKTGIPIEKKNTLEEAVNSAYKTASSGDTVLLSPMCSSFDMFKNYKERGDIFKETVKKLEDK